MIGKILKFELKLRLGNWTTLLFFLMLVFQGIWYTKGTYDFYRSDAILMNAASIFYKNFAGGGMLMIIIVAIITGTALYKDLQYKTGQWLYTFPINEKQFFLGRFLAAYAINVLIALGYFIGMLLTPYSGIGDTSLFGAAPIGQMIHGFVLLLMPNLLLLTAIIFASVVFFRNMAAGYLFVLITVMLFLVMQSGAEGSGASALLIIAEPFSYVAISDILDHYNTVQKNTAYLSMTKYFLINRALWFGITLVLFALAYHKFSFKYFISGKKVKKIKEEVTPPMLVVDPIKISQAPELSFSSLDFIKKLFRLALLEFKNVVRPLGFKVILGIILLMVFLQNVLWNASYYIGPQVPLTSNFTFFRITFGVFIMILLMIWAGELFFKDKIVNIWQITGALPIPVWVTQLSKFLAMAGVALVLSLSFMFLGIVSQTLQGGWGEIDLGLYVSDLLGYKWGWLTYVLQIALVFFVAGLTGNRYLTHVLAIGHFFVLLMGFELGLIEEVRFGFAIIPGIEDYSTISGYGIWGVSAFWYFLMWTSLAIVFVLLGIQFWDRGTASKWYQKLILRGRQLNLAGRVSIFILLVCFVFLQSFIYKRVNVYGNFKSSAEEETELALYERKYSYLKKQAFLKYTKVDLELDFYPEKRKANYKAQILLKNTGKSSTDTLYLNLKDFVTIQSLKVQNTLLKPAWKDDTQNLYAYVLPQVVAPNATLSLKLIAEKCYKGFTQSGEDAQADLMKNGSFGSIQEFLPILGYDQSKTLKDNRKRVEQGLAKLPSRIAAITNQQALQQDAYAEDAEWVTGSLRLSTVAPQICVASGELVKKWQLKNRNYFKYQINQKSPFNWQIGSGRYAILQGNVQQIMTQILHHPGHDFNTKYYQKILHQAIGFVQKKLGTLSGKELRMVEIPYYQEKFYASKNLIAISEKEGWLASTAKLKEKAYLHLTVAAQVSKQWVQQNLRIANVQGADMLQIALPEALALSFVKQQLGNEATQILLDKKKSEYERQRNNDSNGEPPLIRSDGVEYLAINKGAIEMYNLIQKLGIQQAMTLLKQYKSTKIDQYLVFQPLLNHWCNKLPSSDAKYFHRVFKKVKEK